MDWQPLFALVARIYLFCACTRDSRVASYWIDTLVLKKLREILTLLCCITLSSSRENQRNAQEVAVMTVTWWTTSGIILYHRSIAYELSIYCSSLIYFSVAIVIITTKHQKNYFCYRYLLLLLPLLSYYFATKYLAVDIKFLGVVELTTQLLIL